MVFTSKDKHLVGMRLLIVEKLMERLEREGTSEMVVDPTRVGTGEIVIIREGSSARYVFGEGNTPMDTSIVGIVDTIGAG